VDVACSRDNKSVTVDIPEVEPACPARERYPSEPVKTLVAVLCLFLGQASSSASIAVTHDRVPDSRPLPDLLLDNVPFVSWALDVSDVLVIVTTVTSITVALSHRHRFIVLRRMFFLLGLLYLYRAVTMFITVLPKPDPDYACSPRMTNVTAGVYFSRIVAIISGGGLSINGQHVYCGDYIFSGHTVMLTVGYLVITQYSPKRFFLLHWSSFLVSVVGVVLLQLARGHYSVDVVLAYWFSTRLWSHYHTLANNDGLRTTGDHNHLATVWWWRMFLYFEGNVGGQLPREFNWPAPVGFLLGLVTRGTCCRPCRREEDGARFLELKSSCGFI